MSELTDLNQTGNGLAAVSGGLQGLLEAYKMKMAQQVEQSKITQQGLDAGAQARMMMPYHIMQANLAQSALDQKTAHETQTELTAQQAVDQAARSATPNGAPVTSPDGKMFWNGKSWAPFTGAAVVPLKDQLEAKSVVDNLESLKSLIPTLNLSDQPGAGQMMNYLRLAAESKVGGTPANVFLNKMSPAMMGQAHDIAGRFNMAEMPITSNAASFNNTGPSMLKNIQDYQSQLIEKAGLNGYVPKVLPDVPSGPAPAAPAAPGPMGTLRAALPAPTPVPAAPVAPGAAPSPVASGAGKYAHLTDAQLAAMAQGQ